MTGTATREAGQAPAEEAGFLRLDQHVCFALYTASGLMTRIYRPLLEPLGLTYPQYLAMLALWERSPSTVSEVSERLGLEPATLTPLLKRLEQAGLVTRRRDETDERRVLIEPTDEGRALREKAKAVPRDLSCAIGTDQAELAELRRLLGDFIDRLKGATSRE